MSVEQGVSVRKKVMGLLRWMGCMSTFVWMTSIILFVLKFTHVIDISWWWVVSPVVLTFLIGAVFGLIIEALIRN
jgi:ABC-type polysaccharide/polyol phosphate export permease